MLVQATFELSIQLMGVAKNLPRAKRAHGPAPPTSNPGYAPAYYMYSYIYSVFLASSNIVSDQVSIWSDMSRQTAYNVPTANVDIS